jgi:hypothetical protein
MCAMHISVNCSPQNDALPAIFNELLDATDNLLLLQSEASAQMHWMHGTAARQHACAAH